MIIETTRCAGQLQFHVLALGFNRTSFVCNKAQRSDVFCRSEANFGSLLDLELELIFKHLEKEGGIKELLTARLVCKRFKDACQDWRASSLVEVRSVLGLEQVSRALPKLSQLSVLDIEGGSGLSLISKFSHLTMLDLTNSGGRNNVRVDFCFLATRVKHLCVRNIFPDQFSIKSDSLIEVTKLEFEWTADFPSELHNSLQPLRELQV